MEPSRNTFFQLLLIVSEVTLITFLDYKVAELYYSLDVFYCFPVIQAARLSALRAQLKTDTRIPALIGVISAIAWSATEAAVVWPHYPLSAVAINIVTRGITFTVLGRIVAKLWKEREYSRKDSMTDLANRLEFLERFEAERLHSERSGAPYSLLFIDIDKLKILNDNQGHHSGDLALRAMADILRECSRKQDTVSRFGGDEFVLLFSDTNEQICQTLIARIESAANNKFREQNWPISLSIGCVTETGQQRSVDEILHSADQRMYSIKKTK